MENLKKTPLYEIYPSYGAKVIDFGGWALPVQFQGIIEEHNNVRTNAGLFDVSHMGEIMVEGPGALEFLQYLSTNDVSTMANRQALYTLFCNENGGIVDDLLIYKMMDDRYMLVVNAANTDKDFAWIQDQLSKGDWDVKLDNISDQMALLALQGPKAEYVLQLMTDYDLGSIKRFRFADHVIVDGVPALVARTGYTGEDGFELYVANEHAIKLWEDILDAGKDHGVQPAGLGARDTLRLEAGLSLYGNELNDEITPLEANLGFFVKLNKEKFIGKPVLGQQKAEGIKRKIVGFKMLGKGIARTGYPIEVDGLEVGQVTSGTVSPTLKENIGFALVDIDYAKLDQVVEIVVRNRKIEAQIIKTPFYKK